MKAEVEYTALVSVEGDLETGEVAAVGIRPTRDEPETPSEVTVSLESETDQPDEVFDRAQQLVGAAAPFELHGWWAPAPTQRWTPVVERSTDADAGEEDAPVKLRRPPAKEVGKPPPFAVVFADLLPASHREALRDAAITYLHECFSAIANGEPGQSYADTQIGSYLPSRYEQYYDGRFARDWTTTVAVVGWKLAQPGDVTLACVAEELAVFALIRQARMLLDLRERESDEQAWSDFRDLVQDRDRRLPVTVEDRLRLGPLHTGRFRRQAPGPCPSPERLPFLFAAARSAARAFAPSFAIVARACRTVG